MNRNNNLLFEWDSEKEKKNIAKHGIDFKIARFVFDDINRIEILDTQHSTLEEIRYITLGYVSKVLFVVYTERNNAIRIISARVATREEARLYYHGNGEKYS